MTTGTERGNSAMSLDRAQAEPALQVHIDFVRCLKKQPPCCNTSGLSWTVVSKWRAMGHVASSAPFLLAWIKYKSYLYSDGTDLSWQTCNWNKETQTHHFCFSFFTPAPSMFYRPYWLFLRSFRAFLPCLTLRSSSSQGWSWIWSWTRTWASWGSRVGWLSDHF